MSTWEVRQGDSRMVLAGLPNDSVDAIVQDPPAGIAFMGHGWDRDKGGRTAWVDWLAGILREALRVAKPGANSLTWALPRTAHWTAWALEEAGWEIRDCLTHLFGSGFPKSLNLGQGRGTALKPAAEFWWLARKPFAGSVAANVETWGTGALEIDRCRIEAAPRARPPQDPNQIFGVYQAIATQSHPSGRWPPHLLLSHSPSCRPDGVRRVQTKSGSPVVIARQPDGFFSGLNNAGGVRKPTYHAPDGTETVASWACAHGCPVAEIDRQSGDRVSGQETGQRGTGGIWSGESNQPCGPQYGDRGGASRFFPTFAWDPAIDAPFLYQPKPSRRERDAGLDDLPHQSGGALTGRQEGSAGLAHPRAGAGRTGGGRCTHPTVKSIALMRWLCRLVTPPGGLILDPFAGSGTTGIAAVLEGCRFLGIEQEAEYVELARRRIAHWAATGAPPRAKEPTRTSSPARTPRPRPAQLVLL